MDWYLAEVTATPQDEDLVGLGEALDWQISIARHRNAPIAAEMLLTLRDDASNGGPMAELLPRHARFGDLIGLRLLGVLHRLALERKAPGLALWFPTLGGTSPFDASDPGRAVADLRARTLEALIDHPKDLAAALAQVPQTNETGRARMLRCALSRLPADRPVRLIEIACSAGLNLRADRLPGDPALEAGPMPPIVERLGCDLAPIDPTTTEGRLLLTSYIWVDSLERFERLRNALDLAQQVPATLVRADAAEFLAGISPEPGVITVIWHSAMWTYLSTATQEAITRELDRIGAQATPDQPVAEVGFESDGPGAGTNFLLTVRCWGIGNAGEGQAIALAQAGPHGTPAELL